MDQKSKQKEKVPNVGIEEAPQVSIEPPKFVFKENDEEV